MRATSRPSTETAWTTHSGGARTSTTTIPRCSFMSKPFADMTVRMASDTKIMSTIAIAVWSATSGCFSTRVTRLTRASSSVEYVRENIGVLDVSVQRKTCAPSALPTPVTEALPGVALQHLIAHGLHKREAAAGGAQLDLQEPIMPTQGGHLGRSRRRP